MKYWTVREPGILMRHLLTGETFDSWDFLLAKIKTGNYHEIDGTRIPAFYEDSEETDRKYLQWKEIRHIIYEIIRGKRLPIMMQLVLRREKESVPEEGLNCLLNIRFQEGVLQVMSGISRTAFSLDKTAEQIWDTEVENFLRSVGIVLTDTVGDAEK